jgi:hypothetical protein
MLDSSGNSGWHLGYDFTETKVQGCLYLRYMLAISAWITEEHVWVLRGLLFVKVFHVFLFMAI